MSDYKFMSLDEAKRCGIVVDASAAPEQPAVIKVAVTTSATGSMTMGPMEQPAAQGGLVERVQKVITAREGYLPEPAGKHLLAVLWETHDALAAQQAEIAELKGSLVGITAAWKRDYEGQKERGDNWMRDCKKAEAEIAELKRQLAAK